jgi:hypothetical protein
MGKLHKNNDYRNIFEGLHTTQEVRGEMKMIKIADLLMEGTTTRRVNLVNLEVVLGNLAHHLSTEEQKKLAEAFINLCEVSVVLNETQYTIFNTTQWQLLNMILAGKLAELRLIAEDIAEDNKEVDCWPLIKAIDSVFTK